MSRDLLFWRDVEQTGAHADKELVTLHDSAEDRSYRDAQASRNKYGGKNMLILTWLFIYNDVRRVTETKSSTERVGVSGVNRYVKLPCGDNSLLVRTNRNIWVLETLHGVTEVAKEMYGHSSA